MDRDDLSPDEVEFDEIESVNQYEATFTGAVDGEEVTLVYSLENAIGIEDEATLYLPGDEELEGVVVHPDTYEFETDDRDTVRFAATDDDGEDLFLIYGLSEAEDADSNAVGLSVDSNS